MKMKVAAIFFLLPLAALSLDIKKEYFTDASIACDPSGHNFTSSSPIVSKHWLVPTGDVIDDTFKGEHYSIDGNFTLTIHRLDDPDFGYYFCLLVRNDTTLDQIRHGINIDGPYFGDLLAVYSKKAMIGGIAAGSLFVILAGFCIVWNFRYHKRNQRNKAVDELDKAIDGYDLKAYNNVGLEINEDTPKTDNVPQDGANGVGPGNEENKI